VGFLVGFPYLGHGYRPWYRNTLIYISGKGIILQEPSVIAIDQNDKVPLAVGTKQKKMMGRTPRNVVVVRPLRNVLSPTSIQLS